jgi:hypothetical protein
MLARCEGMSPPATPGWPLMDREAIEKRSVYLSRFIDAQPAIAAE